MSKVLVDRDRVVESMCLTWRHDFGLDKLEGCDFCSGMTDKEREHLRGQMGKLFDHHFAPALSAVTAERDRLREDRDSQQRVCIAEMEKANQLRAEVEALRALLGKSLPVVEAHAGASHMLDGFRPARNKWDELVDGIRAAMAAKEA